MFRIRKMSLNDLEFAVSLTDTMKWELREEDLKFTIGLEPDGCFVLLYDSERVGIVTNVNLGRLGWLGNLIVNASHRKMGAGSRLVRRSIRYLKEKSETVGLYSYVRTTAFYKGHGFRHDSMFLALEGTGFSSRANACLRGASKEDIEEIVEFDKQNFGASRRKILEPILSDPQNFCYVYIGDGGMLGYVMAKVYGQTVEIGPLVSRQGRVDVAIELLKEALNKLRGLKVTMYVPEEESAIINMLTKRGFKESFRVARMFFGQDFSQKSVYIAESLERG